MKLEILIKNYQSHINFTLESAKKNMGIDLYQGYKNFQNLLVRPFLAVFGCFCYFLASLWHLYYGYLIFYRMATNFRLKCLRINKKNLRRIMVRDGICGESANGLKNGCSRWSVWVWVGQAGRSEKAFQTDSMLFLVHY